MSNSRKPKNERPATELDGECLYSPTQLAAELGCQPSWVWREVTEGRLPHVITGAGTWTAQRVRASDWAAFKAALARDGRAPAPGVPTSAWTGTAKERNGDRVRRAAEDRLLYLLREREPGWTKKYAAMKKAGFGRLPLPERVTTLVNLAALLTVQRTRPSLAAGLDDLADGKPHHAATGAVSRCAGLLNRVLTKPLRLAWEGVLRYDE